MLSDAIAWRTLLGLTIGIPPESLSTLTTDCLSWPSEDTVLVSWFKPRGGGAASATFPAKGAWSAGRLIERWLAHSARLRAFVDDDAANRLWLWWTHGDRAINTIDPGRQTAWARRIGLLDDGGEPLQLHLGRVRKTWFARHDRAWSGALPIDPTHSATIEGDRYLTAAPRTDAIEAVIEAAQQEALRKAASVQATVLSAAELIDVADGKHPDLTIPTDVADGSRDVFVAACRDFFNSPHGPSGSPCPAPVWECLFCPLALFTPSRLPNLLRMKDHMDRQWDRLEAAEWIRMYGAAQVRLDRDILSGFPDAEIAAARSSIDDTPFYLPPELEQ
jgi:hypothetical protein